MAKIGAAWSACPLFAIEQARRPCLLPFVERMVSAQLPLPNMMEEDADHPAGLSCVEEIGRNALDCILQVQKLRFPVGGHRTFGAGKLIHRRAADLAGDADASCLVNHREFESHPADVVTYYPAPFERHRKSPTPGLTKMCPFAGLVERVGRLPEGTRDSVAKTTPRYGAQGSLRPANKKTARRRLSISAAPAQHGKERSSCTTRQGNIRISRKRYGD